MIKIAPSCFGAWVNWEAIRTGSTAKHREAQDSSTAERAGHPTSGTLLAVNPAAKDVLDRLTTLGAPPPPPPDHQSDHRGK